MMNMEIKSTSAKSIHLVQRIYQEARAYQYKKTGYGWPFFSNQIIENEIREKQHFTILYNNKIIAGVFTILNIEPAIWEDMNGYEAIYLRRLAIRDQYRGKKLGAAAVEWAIIEAKKLNKKYIRIDLESGNEKLITHFQTLGFKSAGTKDLIPGKDLPTDYNIIEVNLLEMKL